MILTVPQGNVCKQCHQPPMTGHGESIPPVKIVIWGMTYCCFTYINRFVMSLELIYNRCMDFIEAMVNKFMYISKV